MRSEWIEVKPNRWKFECYFGTAEIYKSVTHRWRARYSFLGQPIIGCVGDSPEQLKISLYQMYNSAAQIVKVQFKERN